MVGFRFLQVYLEAGAEVWFRGRSLGNNTWEACPCLALDKETVHYLPFPSYLQSPADPGTIINFFFFFETCSPLEQHTHLGILPDLGPYVQLNRPWTICPARLCSAGAFVVGHGRASRRKP